MSKTVLAVGSLIAVSIVTAATGCGLGASQSQDSRKQEETIKKQAEEIASLHRDVEALSRQIAQMDVDAANSKANALSKRDHAYRNLGCNPTFEQLQEAEKKVQ
jgi:cell division protein FtsB